MEDIVNGRAASPASALSSVKPLDRRKATSVQDLVDDVESAQVEDSAVEMRLVGEDVEMAYDSEPVATPTKPKARQAKTESVSRAEVPFPVALPEKDRTKLVKELYGSLKPQELQYIQRIVLEKATGKRPIPLVNLDTEYAKVASVVNQTVTAGESNSMLLIGARGCGKTALVNRILREQTAQNPGDFYVVQLSGFIHTDDKIALREIWRQLGREMDQEEETTSKNYADTLTTLLALLSHPAETGRESDDQVTKSVIFVLDEFELFATHPRQTLLYNLFDIAQSRKAPIAVLGLTTKIDVAETLEKRVKSRFSHRYVHLSLAKSFQAYEETCKKALCIASTELTDEERKVLHASTNLGSKLQKASNGPQPDCSSLRQWSEIVEQLFLLDTVDKYLRRLYYTTKSVSQFLAYMLYPTSSMPVDASTAASALLAHLDTSLSSTSVQPPDSKLGLLPSLSTLQIGLLVSAARLTNIYDAETISFALAYDEYKALASKVKLQASASGAIAQGAGSRVWGRDLAKAAWEALIQCGFILEDARAGGAGRVDIGLEEIGMSGVDLGVWARWCKEI